MAILPFSTNCIFVFFFPLFWDPAHPLQSCCEFVAHFWHLGWKKKQREKQSSHLLSTCVTFRNAHAHIPSQSAPSVSSCVAANGDDPVTGASLPTCREPSRSALREEERDGVRGGRDSCILSSCKQQFHLICSINPTLLHWQRAKRSHNALCQAAF